VEKFAKSSNSMGYGFHPCLRALAGLARSMGEVVPRAVLATTWCKSQEHVGI
jgi:hypothetical protein